MSCQEEVTVDPPPRSELKYTTHIACLEQSFWWEIPKCIGFSGTGTCLCCSQAGLCRLKNSEDIDNYQDGHSKMHCCGIKAYKEQGCRNCLWASSAGRGTCCFCFEQKYQYECRWPVTCCKCAQQSCCCDYRFALPMDEEVPFGCAICGKWFKGSPEEIKDWKSGPPTQYMGQRQVVGK